MMTLNDAAERFVRWLDEKVLVAGRGDELAALDVDPAGRFWFGRLAPESAVLERGERGERLDPCATGMILRPTGILPWSFDTVVRACSWMRESDGTWRKSPSVTVEIGVRIESFGTYAFGGDALARSLEEACGVQGLLAEVRVEAQRDVSSKPELVIQLVNTSPEKHSTLRDTNLYECSLEVSSLATEDFVLESLPDSFRYDRRVPAYGINCGIERTARAGFRTVDVIRVERGRPVYWNVSESEPDIRFRSLATDALPILEMFCRTVRRWGEVAWADASLDTRAERDLWSTAMREQAATAADEFAVERDRIEAGLRRLRTDPVLLNAFQLMNEAMEISSNAKYDRWRPFQLGFLLANLAAITNPDEENEVADIVWFATGGGKTETYLGLIVTAALYDRCRGKKSGITAWSRFPLRMLSLQQTQRFANALAGAELVRRRASIPGMPFSVGFFVGDGATPNRVRQDAKPGEPNPDDEEMAKRYQVLMQCPFCRGADIEMRFNRRQWRLEHRCRAESCPWDGEALPFYIVDEEIYRFLPTAVVGTLDKAALIAFQAAMRGFVGAPMGLCSAEGHGYVYAPRGDRPNGCLAPGCRRKTGPLDMPAELFAPTFRLQDELHLLRDSLGAVDSHYEALFDDLQKTLSGRKPKILASSATLTGYAQQAAVLYQRTGRVFPAQGPTAAEGFWTSESTVLARRFVAVAPRGVTLEYAVDRTLTELQRTIRRFVSDPDSVCSETGIDAKFVPDLLSLYGVNVVFGNTLRDLEAVTRSLETQVPVDGSLNTASLTGRTEFEEVRKTLSRLEDPEDAFDDRIHVVAASSMMSHGVDVDRLNIMAVLGLPLTTAEFIQSTARVGRRWPGLVFVFHKIGREREAGVYRAFEQFVRQGDRFVEPIPVTRRSRNVLERTIAGIMLARVHAIHEPESREALTKIGALRKHFQSKGITQETELAAVINALGFEAPLDVSLREDLERWLARFFRNLDDPGGNFRWPSDLCPTGQPMRSLRDVEEQAPVLGLLNV